MPVGGAKLHSGLTSASHMIKDTGPSVQSDSVPMVELNYSVSLTIWEVFFFAPPLFKQASTGVNRWCCH